MGGSSSKTDLAQPVRREPDRPLPASDGWYWQENDKSWHRYEQTTSGISSETIEKNYRLHPRGTTEFTRGVFSYVINFQTMMQKNLKTDVERKLRRVVVKNAWFWQEDDGKWYPFDAGISDAIEEHFAKNWASVYTFSPSGIGPSQIQYEIDLTWLLQTNKSTKKQRAVLRAPSGVSLPANTQLKSSNVWQWETDNKTWMKFDVAPGMVSSNALETACQENRETSLRFHCNNYLYVIDPKRMTQTNETTGKVRNLQRVL